MIGRNTRIMGILLLIILGVGLWRGEVDDLFAGILFCALVVCGLTMLCAKDPKPMSTLAEEFATAIGHKPGVAQAGYVTLSASLCQAVLRELQKGENVQPSPYDAKSHEGFYL